MLNIVARTANKDTVLILEWSRGLLLALHGDGTLREYRVNELKADLLESQMRIATNERVNAELFAEVVSE